MTYVTAFIFYTLAMIGILLIGFVVYKKVFENTKGVNGGLIKILDSTPIGHKKLLLVVQVRNSPNGKMPTKYKTCQKYTKKRKNCPVNN